MGRLNSFVLVASLFFASASFAAPEPAVDNSGWVSVPSGSLEANADIFGTLLTWYATGVNVTYDMSTGYYSGRCYYTNQPNQPVNSLLGIVKKTFPSDNGPAFPPTEFKKLVELGAVGQPETYFDNWTATWARNEVTKLFDAYGEIEDVNGTLTGILNVVPPTTMGLRHSNGYYVIAYNATANGNYQPRGQSAPIAVTAGQVWCACYYFKRLVN